MPAPRLQVLRGNLYKHKPENLQDTPMPSTLFRNIGDEHLKIVLPVCRCKLHSETLLDLKYEVSLPASGGLVTAPNTSFQPPKAERTRHRVESGHSELREEVAGQALPVTGAFKFRLASHRCFIEGGFYIARPSFPGRPKLAPGCAGLQSFILGKVSLPGLAPRTSATTSRRPVVPWCISCTAFASSLGGDTE